MRYTRLINNLRVVRTWPGDPNYKVGLPWAVFSPKDVVLGQFQREASAVRHAEIDLTYVPGQGQWQVVMESNLQACAIKTFVRSLPIANRLARYYVNQRGDAGNSWFRLAIVTSVEEKKERFRIVLTASDRRPVRIERPRRKRSKGAVRVGRPKNR